MYKKGFTLAETLITLGIIGIISTLTLPSLISNYKNKVAVSQLQKIYNQFSNAAIQCLADNQVDSLADTYLAEDDGPEQFLKEYFKISRNCGAPQEGVSDCFAATYGSLDNSQTSAPVVYGYCVALVTGASVCIGTMDADDSGYHGISKVTVDVNGKAAPNIGGRDLFTFDLYSDGNIGEAYLPGEHHADKCEELGNTTTSSAYGAGCFQRIMSDGWKMDY